MVALGGVYRGADKVKEVTGALQSDLREMVATACV